ncbi:shikimate kinase [Verrucomicrobia bacterium LW23]|nr:shikimate kinase [Verrucomicrobia bacterium LW23]
MERAQARGEEITVRHITLLGMMGAGKSSVGRELSQLLRRPFYDSDFEIERSTRMTIPDIFAKRGEPWFRDREAQIIADIVEETQPVVLSIGGGAFVRDTTRALLLRDTITVYLRATLPSLLARLHGGHGRPLLSSSEDLTTRLTTLMETRGPLYSQAALLIDTDDAQPREVARRVAVAVQALR